MELETPYELYNATSPPRQRSKTLRDRKLQYLRVCEVLVLAPIMLLIVGVFSIPTLVYVASSISGVETVVRFCVLMYNTVAVNIGPEPFCSYNGRTWYNS